MGCGDGEMKARARGVGTNEAQNWARESESRAEMREKRVKKGALWVRKAGGCEDAVRKRYLLVGGRVSTDCMGAVEREVRAAAQ